MLALLCGFVVRVKKQPKLDPKQAPTTQSDTIPLETTQSDSTSTNSAQTGDTQPENTQSEPSNVTIGAVIITE